LGKNEGKELRRFYLLEAEFRIECGKLYYLFLNNLFVTDEPMLLSEALTLAKQILTVSDDNPSLN